MSIKSLQSYYYSKRETFRGGRGYDRPCLAPGGLQASEAVAKQSNPAVVKKSGATKEVNEGKEWFATLRSYQ